jgi:hypothetical protein
MPYIKQETRFDLDDRLSDLAYQTRYLGGGVGECNYLITKLLLEVLKPETYTEFNAAIGVLECCKLEMYRRAVAPYEDVKSQTNGDVYPSMSVAIESNH